MTYEELVMQLESEWPKERLRSFVLDYLRDSCRWTKVKKAAIELANRDARQQGVSYKERKKYSDQIAALDGLFLKWRERGIKYKRVDVSIAEIVTPEDVDLIHQLGFEWHLKSAIIW